MISIGQISQGRRRSQTLEKKGERQEKRRGSRDKYASGAGDPLNNSSLIGVQLPIITFAESYSEMSTPEHTSLKSTFHREGGEILDARLALEVCIHVLFGRPLRGERPYPETR